MHPSARAGSPPAGGATRAPLRLSSRKREVTIDPPWMNASGFLGFAAEARGLFDPDLLGAVVTNPVSLAPRSPAQGPRWLPAAGGFLLHTGLPNPGLRQVVRRWRRRWAATRPPVFVHLLARDPDEAGEMARLLEAVEEVAGVEVGIDGDDPEETRALVAAASAGQLIALARLPLDAAPAAALAAQQGGAAGISLGPPRGELPSAGGRIGGRLYGPALLPLALRRVSALAAALDIPIIGSGGLYSRGSVEAMLAGGASAVQLDGVLWTEPEIVLQVER
jgi:dihydroorotate dehydrogenase (NAD+) catalytic subunit